MLKKGFFRSFFFHPITIFPSQCFFPREHFLVFFHIKDVGKGPKAIRECAGNGCSICNTMLFKCLLKTPSAYPTPNSNSIPSKSPNNPYHKDSQIAMIWWSRVVKYVMGVWDHSVGCIMVREDLIQVVSEEASSLGVRFFRPISKLIAKAKSNFNALHKGLILFD